MHWRSTLNNLLCLCHIVPTPATSYSASTAFRSEAAAVDPPEAKVSQGLSHGLRTSVDQRAGLRPSQERGPPPDVSPLCLVDESYPRDAWFRTDIPGIQPCRNRQLARTSDRSQRLEALLRLRPLLPNLKLPSKSSFLFEFVKYQNWLIALHLSYKDNKRML